MTNGETRLTFILRWRLSKCEHQRFRGLTAQARSSLLTQATAGFLNSKQAAWDARGDIQDSILALPNMSGATIACVSTADGSGEPDRLRSLSVTAIFAARGTDDRRAEETTIKRAILDGVLQGTETSNQEEANAFCDANEPIEPGEGETTLAPCPECGPNYLCEISADGTFLRCVDVGTVEIATIEEVHIAAL